MVEKNKELIETIRLLGRELEDSQKIHKTKVSDLFKLFPNRIFSCVFVKKNGEIRTMNCRLGVKKGVRGTGKSISSPSNSYVTVFDMNKDQFRVINLETMIMINIGGKQYYVEI
jgi:hypothetical protein